MSTLLKGRAAIGLILRILNKKPITNSKCIATLAPKLPRATILACHKPAIEIHRTKSKASKKKEKAEESDEEETAEEVGADFESLIVDKNTKIITTKVNSLRADVLLKSGLSIARNKVEELFYDSKIRVNGKKLLKKSDLVQEGDELDVIKGVNINNPKFLTVARVEILEVTLKKDSYSVRLRRCKNLTVENYEDA